MLESFKLFCGKDNTIRVTNLKRVAKELGDTISDGELQTIMNELSKTGEITENDWIRIMSTIVRLLTF